MGEAGNKFLMLIGGLGHIQATYLANLLQGAVQHLFRHECDASCHPDRWKKVQETLLERFVNCKKVENGQSVLMSINKGRNERPMIMHFEF